MFLERYPAEVFHDFRHYYHVSAEWIGTPALSWAESSLLFQGLQAHPESLLVTKVSGMDRPASRIELLLIAIQNALVDLLIIQVGKKDKKNASNLKLKMPQRIQTKKKKRMISKEEALKRLSFSRIAEPTKKEE